MLILNDKNQILLGHRHNNPTKTDNKLNGQDTWTMPGGKLDWQETPLVGALRELKEETSLIGKNLKLISVTNDAVTEHHFITIGFLCKKFIGTPQIMEPDKITEWQWFDLNKLPKKIFFSSQKILNNYLNKKLYTE